MSALYEGHREGVLKARFTTDEAAALLKASNLSDVADTASSRYNVHVPILASAQAVATANVASRSGAPTLDGVTPAAGDIVLLTAQTTGSQNGPWVTAAGAWTRPPDYPAAGSVKGRCIEVNAGTLYSGTLWVLATTTTVTIDTTSTTWKQANSGTFAPLGALVVTDWAASTAYVAGQLVLSPIGQYKPGVKTLVQAVTGFTSGGSFNTANWLALNPGMMTASGYAEFANQTTDNTFLTCPTIDPALLVANQTRFRIDIDAISDSVNAGGAFLFKIKVNGTLVIGNLIVVVSQTGGNVTAKPGAVFGQLHVDAIGSGGVLSFLGKRLQTVASGSLSATLIDATAVAGVAVNLSAGLTITITGSMGVADAASKLRGWANVVQVA